MKIPDAALREVITVEPYRGSGAYGPIYGDAFTLRARVEGRRRAVRNREGVDVISSASATIRPDAREVPAESKVTHDGNDYEVLDVIIGEGLTRPAYRELILG